MSYFVQSDLEAFIPLAWLVEGLDDDDNGVEDAFAKVQTAAEREVNGALSLRYAVPLNVVSNEGLAAFLSNLCCLIAVEMIYIRRGKEMTEARTKILTEARKRLVAISKGEDPLSPVVKAVNPSGVIIGETSRVHSASIAL